MVLGHTHTGPRSYNQVRDLIRQKEGIEPSMLRILRETHKKPDGTYVDGRAQFIDEEVQRQLQASQGSDGSDLTHLEEDEMYLKVVLPLKGRVFGLGGQPTQFERGESSSAALNRITLERQVTALKEQLQTVIQYVKQFMPEGATNDLHTTPPRAQGTGASATGPARVFTTESIAKSLNELIPTTIWMELSRLSLQTQIQIPSMKNPTR